jgi:hypothetical protein
MPIRTDYVRNNFLSVALNIERSQSRVLLTINGEGYGGVTVLLKPVFQHLSELRMKMKNSDAENQTRCLSNGWQSPDRDAPQTHT